MNNNLIENYKKKKIKFEFYTSEIFVEAYIILEKILKLTLLKFKTKLMSFNFDLKRKTRQERRRAKLIMDRQPDV